jgi:glycosyltransferase involved in cell wall biosynthesis
MSTKDDYLCPVIIATTLRAEGVTGVHTHIRQLQEYLETEHASSALLITPSSWMRILGRFTFGMNCLLRRVSGSAAVVWYLYWHEMFLRNALRRHLARIGTCVIYAQSPTAARAALDARANTSQRVVVAVHFTTSYADEFASEYIGRCGKVFQWIRKNERLIMPSVDRIVYVSDAARRALVSWLPEVQSVPSAVISNFVTPITLSVVAEACSDLVSIGALRALKNHRFLLEVLVEAKRAGWTLTLDVFGDGPDRRQLERVTRSLGLEAQVRWCGFHPDVREVLAGYKVYVHSSLSEAMPLAIVEAMAAGLPVVAGEVGGIAEMGEVGSELRFWPLDNPSKAAEILLELLCSDANRDCASRAAVDRFHRDYDARVIGRRLMNFLSDPDVSLASIHRLMGPAFGRVDAKGAL